ncbi:2TM domain-containing protein [Tamlana sp. I1]|uniref:2TM domain-containing protein n=1 Tax=Tamlana sp. I1 TaxID=2762061 RepID=UPI001890020C|nr:2TM domain-containing protein [Tamlana sp. I1]
METNNNKYSRNYSKEEAYLKAQKRIKNIKGFYWHAFWYVAVNIFILAMIIPNTHGNIWNLGVFSTPLFWGIGLAFHGLSVFGKNIIFGKAWEDRKIQEYMDKDKKHWE